MEQHNAIYAAQNILKFSWSWYFSTRDRQSFEPRYIKPKFLLLFIHH